MVSSFYCVRLLESKYRFRLLLNPAFINQFVLIIVIKEISVEIINYDKVFICILYFILIISYFLFAGFLYVYRREYSDIFIIFEIVNKYIFYGGAFSLIFISTAMKFIVGNITKKVNWLNNLI